MEPTPARTSPVVIAASCLFVAPWLVLLAQAVPLAGVAAITVVLAGAVLLARS